MEQGPTEQNIIKQCYASRRPLPKSIQNAPDLQFGLELYYGAFSDLNSCRSTGWSDGPIPWSAIADYCVAFRLDAEQVADMFHHIRTMDNAYLKHREKDVKKGIKRG